MHKLQSRHSLALLGVTLALAATSGCSKKAEPIRAMSVPVAVTPAVQKEMPVEIAAIGNVESITAVGVKSMINGEITSVKFQEGQDVRKGDLLFTIDERPSQADLLRNEANLARDIATAANARAQAKRYQALWKEGVIASEQAEQMQTAADAADALVRSDQAAVENSRVQLTYTKIYSPIDGRTGNLSIQLGNVIKANDVALITINQISPIYVTFTIPEQNLEQVTRYQAKHPLQVSALLPNDPVPAVGALTFIDNSVDRQTGTIKLKATFDNRDRRLWPGLFVNTVMRLTSEPNALVVPVRALQTGQQGQFVFVVGEDMKAEVRLVKVLRTIGDQAVVADGVRAGDLVVTEGHLRLTPGAKVELKNNAPQPVPPASATAAKSLS
jgi:multidrug efflux system membrane fusion protein